MNQTRGIVISIIVSIITMELYRLIMAIKRRYINRKILKLDDNTKRSE